MSITALCPECGASYKNLKPGHVGKKTKCKKCGAPFVIQPKPEEPAETVMAEDQPAETVIAEDQPAETVMAEPAEPAETVMEGQNPAETAFEEGNAPTLSGPTMKKKPKIARPPKEGKKIPVDWKIGDVILDRYKVTGLLGEGGMGKVFKVRHLGWNKDLAVKSPKARMLSTKKGKANFEREAETWVNLGLHPNNVSCYYVRDLGGIPRVFAEYISGGSLKDWIQEKKLTKIEDILDVAIQFAWGLQYSHDQGLVHQDIKPANVMMTEDGVAKITDFGLAKAQEAAVVEDDGTPPEFGQNKEVSYGGMTPAYASPEQAAKGKLTAATDIWSWGLSILEMFTGEVTWPSGTVAAAALDDYLESQQEDESLTHIPSPIAWLLRDCFKQDPSQRPESLNAAVEVLKSYYFDKTGKTYHRPAPKSGRDSADGLNNRAVSLLDIGRVDEAVTIWKRALKAQPHHPESTFNMGLGLWRSGAISGGALVKQMQEVIKSHESDWVDDYLMGQVLLERGDYKSAAKFFQDATAHSEGRAEAKSALETAKKKIPRQRKLVRDTKEAGAVSQVEISYDAKKIITRGAGGEVSVWDTASGKRDHQIDAHQDGAAAICFGPAGDVFLTAGKDGVLKTFQTGSCKQLQEFGGNLPGVVCVNISHDGSAAIAGSETGNVKIWDTASGGELISFKAHNGAVNSVCFTSDGKYALTCGADGGTKLWDIKTGVEEIEFRGHDGPVNCAALTGDDFHAVTCGNDTLLLWDTLTGELARKFEENRIQTNCVLFASEGKIIASAGDGFIKFHETETGRLLGGFGKNTGRVESISINSSGKYLVSGGPEGFKLWEADCAEVYLAPMRLSGLTRIENIFASSAEYEHEMELAAKAGANEDIAATLKHIQKARALPGFGRAPEAVEAWCELYTWLPHKGLAGGWESATLRESGEPAHVADISRNGKYVLTAGADGVTVWDCEKGESAQTFTDNDGPVTSARFSYDGASVLTGGMDKSVRLYDLKSSALRANFSGHRSPVNDTALSRDKAIAISCGDDGSIKLWNTRTGEFIRNFKGSDFPASCVMFCHDASRAYTAGKDGVIREWDILTGKRGAMHRDEGNQITSMALGSNGKLFLTFDKGSPSVKLWDAVNGKILRTLEGHRGGVNSAVFTCDGRFILSGGADNTLKLWHCGSGKCLRTFEGHKTAINAVCISQDGMRAVSASEDGMIKLWIFDWELVYKKPADWDNALLPYVEYFLTNSMSYAGGPLDTGDDEKLSEKAIQKSLTRSDTASWDSHDFESLMFDIGCAGFGYVDSGGVQGRVEKMANEMKGASDESYQAKLGAPVDQMMVKDYGSIREAPSGGDTFRYIKIAAELAVGIGIIALAIYLFGTFKSREELTIHRMTKYYTMLYENPDAKRRLFAKDNNSVLSKLSEGVRNRHQILTNSDLFAEYQIVNMDSWGSDFQIDFPEGMITVSSPGPDRRHGTDDDLVLEGSDEEFSFTVNGEPAG